MISLQMVYISLALGIFLGIHADISILIVLEFIHCQTVCNSLKNLAMKDGSGIIDSPFVHCLNIDANELFGLISQILFHFPFIFLKFLH